MTDLSAPSPSAPSPSVRYDVDPSGAVLCDFPETGAFAPAVRGRVRHYPGLTSTAPRTGALYEHAAALLGACSKVLDAGCGSGHGAGVLAAHGLDVLGVDVDDGAVLFADAFAPRARFRREELAELSDVGSVDGVTLIDVLGHVLNPFDVLRALHRRLPPGARVFIAEPAAHPDQVLEAPARRAYSKRGLVSILRASGFEVESWVLEEGTFLAAMVRRVRDPGLESLDRANDALRHGDGDAALAAFQEAGERGSRFLQLEAALAVADIHYSQGRGDGAGQCFFQAKDLDPTDPRPLAGLAQIAVTVGQPADSLSMAKLGLSLDSTDLGCNCALAMALDSLGEDQKAEAWRRSAALAPDMAAVVIRYAEVAAERGQHTSGLGAVERLRRYGDDLGPEFAVAFVRLLRAAGRTQEADLELQLAREAYPSHEALAELV